MTLQTKTKELKISSDRIPAAIDAEKMVLGTFLMESNSIERVADMISEKSFHDGRHKIIFRAIFDLFKKSLPIDILTVTEYLKTITSDDGSEIALKAIGGPYYIVELTNRISSTANLESHASILGLMAMRRELLFTAARSVKMIGDPTIDSVEILESMQNEIIEISEVGMNRKFVDMGSATVNLLKKIEIAERRTSDLVGISTGLNEFDRVTLGLQAPDLIIVAARPGMGKTGFALTVAGNVARQGIPVGIFSLEMSSEQLVERIVSQESGVSVSRIRRGRWGDSGQRNAVFDAAAIASDFKIYVDDSAGLTITEMRTKARNMVLKYGIKLIIVDYLQLMTGESGGNREQDVSSISRGLKNLAKSLDVPVIALSQLSRAVEIRGGTKKPQLSDLRESGAIEQDADIVSFIYRPEYYQILEDADGNSLRGIAEIGFAKNRHGATTEIALKFIETTTGFENIDDDEIGGGLNTPTPPPPPVQGSGNISDPDAFIQPTRPDDIMISGKRARGKKGDDDDIPF